MRSEPRYHRSTLCDEFRKRIMPLARGDVLQKRYGIVALLGQGGMGAVYRAWDLWLKVYIALKEQIPQPR